MTEQEIRDRVEHILEPVVVHIEETIQRVEKALSDVAEGEQPAAEGATTGHYHCDYCGKMNCDGRCKLVPRVDATPVRRLKENFYRYMNHIRERGTGVFVGKVGTEAVKHCYEPEPVDEGTEAVTLEPGESISLPAGTVVEIVSSEDTQSGEPPIGSCYVCGKFIGTAPAYCIECYSKLERESGEAGHE